MKLLSAQWVLLAATVSTAIADSIIKVIPSTPAAAAIDAYFTSTYFGLDGPKLSAVNETSFDWWYFDAVSTDLTSSLAVVFYAALPDAFPFLPPSTSVTTVGVYAQFPNGTVSSTYLTASEATVTTLGQGSSGYFAGTGASWLGALDDSWYNVQIVSPSTGIYGNFNLVSTAPAHYPCDPVGAGKNMMVGPNIGWSNAVPDANANVAFSIGGSTLSFSGVGYHDKNWSNQPFVQNVGSWYWGHGRVGGYSLVWFDFLSTNGTEYVSVYVAKAGKILASSCTLGSITVRPTAANGGDATYPPTVFSGNPGGFHIVVNDTADGLAMTFNVTTDKIVLGDAGGIYTRWTGALTGTVGSGPVLTGGQAVFEEFKLAA